MMLLEFRIVVLKLYYDDDRFSSFDNDAVWPFKNVIFSSAGCTSNIIIKSVMYFT